MIQYLNCTKKFFLEKKSHNFIFNCIINYKKLIKNKNKNKKKL